MVEHTKRTRRLTRRRVLFVLVLLLIALIGWLGLAPVDLDPVAWDPPRNPGYAGAYVVNDGLSAAERIALHESAGPEDVAVDSAGNLYVGVLDSRILRIDPVSLEEEVFAATGGRPLGLAFDPAERLVVADAYRGLLRIDRDGTIETLATGHDGIPLGLTDDVDIGPDGTIYFSDASTKYRLDSFLNDLLEQRGTGRLLSLDPDTGETSLLVDGLCFANGVAVASDGSFVLVVETGRYRVHRHWLRGERAGATEVLIENLPGYPDGISRGSQDRFWIALVSPRKRLIDAIHPYPWAKKIVLRLPSFLRPAPPRTGHVIAIDRDGILVANLHDPTGDSVAVVSSVEEHNAMLYFGSYLEGSFARMLAPGR